MKIPKWTTTFSSLGIPDILYIKYTGLVKAITIFQVISSLMSSIKLKNNINYDNNKHILFKLYVKNHLVPITLKIRLCDSFLCLLSLSCLRVCFSPVPVSGHCTLVSLSVFVLPVLF